MVKLGIAIINCGIIYFMNSFIKTEEILPLTSCFVQLGHNVEIIIGSVSCPKVMV
jgi:hypothetical protein